MNSIDPQKLSEAMALISIAGFAVQRALELLDPLLAGLTYGLSELVKKVHKPQKQTGTPAGELPFGLTEAGLKAWLIAVISFVIGLLIAGAAPVQLLGIANARLNQIVIALAISLGTNGVNSLLKYAEYAKDGRKGEVKPLPVITITPASATVKPNSAIQFLASVTGTDDREVKWKLLETDYHTLDEQTGTFTAPPVPGLYHIAAISRANEAASASAMVTVA